MAVAHAFKQRRSYQPGATLYARELMKFSGVAVAIGQPIPDRPEPQRIALWRTGKADHDPRSPYVQSNPGFTAGGSFAVPQTETAPVRFRATPSERVDVAPSKRRRR